MQQKIVFKLPRHQADALRIEIDVVIDNDSAGRYGKVQFRQFIFDLLAEVGKLVGEMFPAIYSDGAARRPSVIYQVLQVKKISIVIWVGRFLYLWRHQ